MTQTFRSNKSADLFKIQVDKIRKAWLYVDDDDVAAINDLMADLFTEIDDFLTDYTGPTGN